MPELPEVETVRRQLEPQLQEQKITTAWLFWEKTLESPSLEELQEVLSSQRICKLGRRGKYLIIELEKGFLTFHLRMTGRLYLAPSREGQDPWVRLSLGLESGPFLCFSDSRKFGRVTWTSSLEELNRKLGPEPLSMEPMQWADLFKSSHSRLKAFLLNQHKIAGIGNIYADESLFLAGLNPSRPANSLSRKQAVRLGRVIRSCLEQAIQHEGSTISWYRKPDGTQGESQKHFQVYGKGGQPCPICKNPLQKCQIQQRTTVFCAECQK